MNMPHHKKNPKNEMGDQNEVIEFIVGKNKVKITFEHFKC